MAFLEHSDRELDHAHWRSEHGHWRKDVRVWAEQHEHVRWILSEIADLIYKFDQLAANHLREVVNHEDQMLLHHEQRAPTNARVYQRWCQACDRLHEGESDGHLIAKIQHCGLQHLHRAIRGKTELARLALT